MLDTQLPLETIVMRLFMASALAIWVAGAIGLACGAGYFAIAGIVTIFTLIVLLIVGWVERRFFDAAPAKGNH